ncbi:WD40 repeat domain-containing protein [Frigoriglobus tundricola]|uniref:High-affnity carbon uptake protein Hat/HatR n=1 Tax=Frigoriglobus tundricola TaxID=2774151 RepID=A0A6M5YK13_9BACT|nr:WD40 repeat domain-containing protein [Frigoriglobus tundricola]QJW93626.1 High-affnity carbon uptake protein Hat/HatR [Frigoriglobus tundricola]
MARISSIFGKPENRLRPVWQAAVPDHVIGVAWAPDGARLAVAAVSGPIVIFDANTGKPVHQHKGHGFGTAALAWQPAGGALLASVGQDNKVRLWDTAAGQEAKALDAGASWAEKLAWHPSGQYLATAAGKKAKVWSAAGDLVRELPAQAGTVMDLKWRPGTNSLTLLAYGAATTYDPLTGSEPVKVLAWKGSPLAMAWSPDGKILAHGNQDSTVHFWYFDEARDLQMWGYKTKVRELAWEFSSRYMATGGGPVVCIWDCQGGPNGPEGTKPTMLVGHESEANITALAYQARGFLLASTALDGRVLLWQPTNRKGAQVGEFQFTGGESSVVAWSPDDKSLAAGAGTGAVAVFRAG